MSSDGLAVSLLKKWFGPFTRAELRRYLMLGVTFAFVIGIYWTMRVLKDSIFGSIVVGEHRELLAYAKIVSMLLLFPIIAVYSKLLHRFQRDHMIYFMMGIYAVLLVFWGVFFSLPGGLADTVASPWRISGWLWYTFVESWGSLIVALFWAFVADISDAKSARYGFPLIVLVGQLGGIAGPFLVKLPRIFGFTSSAPLIFILAILVAMTALLVVWFMRVTPKEELSGFSGAHTAQAEEEEPGFLEGLRLLLSKKYLLGMFAIISFFEIIATFIDFNFKNMVFSTFDTEMARSAYLGGWASTINTVSLICILLGVNNIQRWLGVRSALAILPCIIAGIVLAFHSFYVIDVLYWLMIGAKAINYALNGPTMKQLYVPTSKDVKYKAQAWIETFGSRCAKASSSGMNSLTKTLGLPLYLAVIFYTSMGLLAFWVFIGLYLGKQYNKAIKENRVVC